jgi:predicted dehydrogenase
MDRPLVRYAVVGLGHVAQHHVLPSFVHVRGNSRLTALVSGDPAKLKRVGARYGVETLGSYDDLEVCLAKADAAYICTSTPTHAEYAVRAARAGKHVICEIPLAVTSDECRQIIEACRGSNVRLMPAYRLHFETLSTEVLARVRRGDIGDPKMFTSTVSLYIRHKGPRTGRSAGGGTLIDLGIYCINAARLLFGQAPTRVVASSIASSAPQSEGHETTAAVLQFGGDRLATFTASFSMADVSSYLVVGTKGSIEMEPAYAASEALAYTVTIGDRDQRKQGARIEQFAGELNYFSDCILKGREPSPSGEEGALDVGIIEALYESARTGDAVDVPVLALR